VDGTVVFMPRNVPVRFTSMTRCQLARSVSVMGDRSYTAALLTSIPIGPKRFSAAATIRCQSASWVTSRAR
jgi:hypothetical protein